MQMLNIFLLIDVPKLNGVLVVFVSEEISPRELNQRGHLTKTGAMNLVCICL